MGKEWHPNCFVCSHPRCDRVLDPKDFETHDGKPYCRQHFQEMFLPKCFACKKPITDVSFKDFYFMLYYYLHFYINRKSFPLSERPGILSASHACSATSRST